MAAAGWAAHLRQHLGPELQHLLAGRLVLRAGSLQQAATAAVAGAAASVKGAAIKRQQLWLVCSILTLPAKQQAHQTRQARQYQWRVWPFLPTLSSAL